MDLIEVQNQDISSDPVLEQANTQARDALACLQIDDLRMLKSYTKPPELIKIVLTCVLRLLCNVNTQVTTKNGKLDEFNVWTDALKLIKHP